MALDPRRSACRMAAWNNIGRAHVTEVHVVGRHSPRVATRGSVCGTGYICNIRIILVGASTPHHRHGVTGLWAPVFG